MKLTYKKYLLILISLFLSCTLTACSITVYDSSQLEIGATPFTMEVGKYTITVLDVVYINDACTTTYIIGSPNEDLDNCTLLPWITDTSMAGYLLYWKDITINKRYMIYTSIIDDKLTPDLVTMEFEGRDDSGTERITVKKRMKFEKNIISDFEYVQARELDYVMPTVDGEMHFYKALYYEGRIAVFADFIGYNNDSDLIENRYDESENYYFKIEGENEEYPFICKGLTFTNDSSWKASPQLYGYDENVIWYGTGYVEIPPLYNQINDETLTLNVYEYGSNQLVVSLALENINPPLYDDY